MKRLTLLLGALGLAVLAVPAVRGVADAPAAAPRAFIDGTGPGWRDLTEADFAPANVDPDTFKWQGNGFDCTGKPIGVTRSRKSFTNLEMTARWRHLENAGNSGIYVWTAPESIAPLKPGQFPSGIELQVLDHGYTAQYEKASGKKADWFTTHGDVFPTSGAKMTPYPPTSPDGSRGFPRKQLSKPAGQWNHYYIRAINGEVRLWVNGEEVSGGKECKPSTGLICFESEGAPVEFRDLRIRELP
jgi:hypothetical protein